MILSCSKNDSSENKSCGGTALSLKNTSYENFKEIDLTPQNHPNGVGRDAVAYADFNQDGQLDMFVATLTYWPPTTQEAATLNVSTSATTHANAGIASFTGDAMTTGKGVTISNDALTTGSALDVSSTSNAKTTGALVNITQTGATTTCL